MSTTIGDGIVAFAIAFAFVGFFWSVTSIDREQSNYEICIDKCPSNAMSGNFINMECPQICERLIENDANCTTSEGGKK